MRQVVLEPNHSTTNKIGRAFRVQARARSGPPQLMEIGNGPMWLLGCGLAEFLDHGKRVGISLPHDRRQCERVEFFFGHEFTRVMG